MLEEVCHELNSHLPDPDHKDLTKFYIDRGVREWVTTCRTSSVSLPLGLGQYMHVTANLDRLY